MTQVKNKIIKLYKSQPVSYQDRWRK